MKKTLMVLGTVFLVLIMALGVFLGYAAVKGKELDAESKEYVLRTVPLICADFDAAVLLKHASPELIAAAPQPELERVMAWLKRVGKLKRIVEAKGDANMSYTTQDGKTITARYTVSAEFDTGPAQIEAGLVKRGDGWKYRLFKVNSMALLQQ